MVLVLLAIPALALLFLQNRQVQTQLTKYLAGNLSEQLQVPITLSSVHVSFFRRAQVRDLFIADFHGDTLLYSGMTRVRIKSFRRDPTEMNISKITLEDAFVNLVIDSSNVVNITCITDRLKKSPDSQESKFHLKISSVELTGSRFSLSRMVHKEAPTAISFSDFHLSDLNILVNNLEFKEGTVQMEVARLSGTERSGFDIDQITTLLSINKSHLHFAGLGIETERSKMNIPLLEFDFESFRKFKEFSTGVELQFVSSKSDLAMSDLSQFVPGTGRIFNHLSIDGKLNGKLNDLSGSDLLVIFDDRSSLDFDFTMIGLPDIRNTFLDFNFRRLQTSVLAVNDMLPTPVDTSSGNLTPWINLGELDFTGLFTGYPDQFVASGLLHTDMGEMVMDLSFEPDSDSGVYFSGKLRTRNFKLGAFLDQEVLAQLDMNVLADGNIRKGQLKANLEGTIDTLELYHYPYSSINLDGSFTNQTFQGGFSISDPNIQLDFNGRTDFSGEVPVYRFTADVARLRPFYLNLPQSDPSYFASFLVETDLSGGSVDELNGEVRLVNSLFERSDAQVQLYDVTMNIRNTPEASLIQVRSDLVDAEVTGQYTLSTLPGSFRNLADRYLNIVPHSNPSKETTNYFNYRIDIKHLNPLLDFFLPQIEIGDHSILSGTYDPKNNHASLEWNLPNLGVGNTQWYHITARAEAGEEKLDAVLNADSMAFGGNYSLQNQEIRLTTYRDTAFLDIGWDNGEFPAYSGGISLFGTFEDESVPERGFSITLEPGTVVINDMNWIIHPSGLLVRKAYLEVSNFEITSSGKRILANGEISSGQGHDFQLELENLDLAGLINLTGINADLAGMASGYLHYMHMDEAPVISADLDIDSLYLNRQYLGNTKLRANWDEPDGSLGISLLAEAEGNRIVEVSGDYVPEGGLLDFDIALGGFELATLEPYTRNIASNLDGTARANLTLDGTLDSPELNGVLSFGNGSATINYLKTNYVFDDTVRIYRNNLYFEDFLVRDMNSNVAKVSGSVSNTHFKDFYINLNINADNLQCMNTKSADNEVFYGTVFATGNVSFNGKPDNLQLKIKASTGKNTALFLPLYNASEVASSDFLTFIEKQEIESKTIESPSRKLKGLQLDMEVGITNDAMVQLIFDPKVGDIIEARGRGTLRMILDQNRGFLMLGDVVLDQGDYLFTLQNVINKKFKIEPGGKINFNGVPTDATVDLKAIYATRTAPYNLYPDHDDTKESLKKRIPVECHLNLQGDLRNPKISPSIIMPTADAETKNLLENATSTDEELMKQFLSLLVINNFYSVTGFEVEDVGTSNIAGVTASELLSNQLSNWLSQISDDFDIGVNYRPGDQVTSDELEVALSTQLLNDRIIISTNVDMGGNETNPSSDASANPYIYGEFDLEFKVTDNVSILAFNRARDELLYETGRYKQGIGVSFREEFDTLGLLIDRYKEGLTNRKKKKKKSDSPQAEE